MDNSNRGGNNEYNGNIGEIMKMEIIDKQNKKKKNVGRNSIHSYEEDEECNDGNNEETKKTDVTSYDSPKSPQGPDCGNDAIMEDDDEASQEKKHKDNNLSFCLLDVTGGECCDNKQNPDEKIAVNDVTYIAKETSDSNRDSIDDDDDDACQIGRSGKEPMSNPTKSDSRTGDSRKGDYRKSEKMMANGDNDMHARKSHHSNNNNNLKSTSGTNSRQIYSSQDYLNAKRREEEEEGSKRREEDGEEFNKLKSMDRGSSVVQRKSALDFSNRTGVSAVSAGGSSNYSVRDVGRKTKRRMSQDDPNSQQHESHQYGRKHSTNEAHGNTSIPRRNISSSRSVHRSTSVVGVGVDNEIRSRERQRNRSQHETQRNRSQQDVKMRATTKDRQEEQKPSTTRPHRSTTRPRGDADEDKPTHSVRSSSLDRSQIISSRSQSVSSLGMTRYSRGGSSSGLSRSGSHLKSYQDLIMSERRGSLGLLMQDESDSSRLRNINMSKSARELKSCQDFTSGREGSLRDVDVSSRQRSNNNLTRQWSNLSRSAGHVQEFARERKKGSPQEQDGSSRQRNGSPQDSRSSRQNNNNLSSSTGQLKSYQGLITSENKGSLPQDYYGSSRQMDGLIRRRDNLSRSAGHLQEFARERKGSPHDGSSRRRKGSPLDGSFRRNNNLTRSDGQLKSYQDLINKEESDALYSGNRSKRMNKQNSRRDYRNTRRLSNCYEDDNDKDVEDDEQTELLWMLSWDSLDEKKIMSFDAMGENSAQKQLGNIDEKSRGIADSLVQGDKDKGDGDQGNIFAAQSSRSSQDRAKNDKERRARRKSCGNKGNESPKLASDANTDEGTAIENRMLKPSPNKRLAETATDVAAENPTINSHRSNSTESMEDDDEVHKHELYVSPFMVCILIFCYGVSLCVIGVLGFGASFGVHMFFDANKGDDIISTSPSRDKGGSGSNIYSEADILLEVNAEVSPSFNPSPKERSIESVLPTDDEVNLVKTPPPFTFYASDSPSGYPTYISRPSTLPSLILSTMFPSRSPSFNPSSSPSLSIESSTSHSSSLSSSTSPSSWPTYSPTKISSMQPPLESSYLPLPSPTLIPSTQPSFPPSYSPSSGPTLIPSTQPSIPPSNSPSSSPTLISSMQPSFPPSCSPSSIPTTEPKCPEQLLKSTYLDDEKLLELRYEVVLDPGEVANFSGRLCISLEYSGVAGWIGLAFSEATNDPQFERMEAIIGIPGMRTSTVVATEENGASLGQQMFSLEGEHLFANPGKYEIPAGGIAKGFSGPSLNRLSGIDKQTLRNGSVSAIDAYLDHIDITPDFMSTRMSFEKNLREPDEIGIDPYESTILLYAVAPLDHGGEYDGNPEWRYTYLNLLESSPDVLIAGPDRKRMRKHEDDAVHR